MKKHLGNIISWSSMIIVLCSLIFVNKGFLSITLLFFTVSLASILDAFDGKVARLFLNSKDDFLFGEITDSLCDVINFGIAPIFVLLYLSNVYPIISTIVSLFYIWAVVFRLARFSRNKNINKGKYFDGVPVTVIGPFSIFIALLLQNYILIVYFVFILLAFFMLSKFKIKKL